MVSIKYVEFESREEWLVWRRGGVGSSDASILAATSGLCEAPSWVDRLGDQILFWDKLNMTRPKKANAAMQRGNEMEEGLRCRAEARLGFLAPANAARADAPWLRASFDGLTVDGAPAEIKAPSVKVAQMAKEGIIYGAYEAQIAHQLMVLHGHPDQWTGDEAFHYIVHDLRDDDLHIISDASRRLQALAAKLYAIEERFWSHVAQREPVVGGADWMKLACTLSETKTSLVDAEYYRQLVISAVRNKGYEPLRYHVRQVAPATTKTVDWKAVYDEAGADPAWVDAQAGEPIWNVSGGAGCAVEEIDHGNVTPEQAEAMLPLFAEMEKDCDAIADRAREVSRVLGTDLVGPFGLRVYKRRGNIKHKELVASLGIGDATIAAHTKLTERAGYTSLTPKRAKAMLAA